MVVTPGTTAGHPGALKPVNLRGLIGEKRAASTVVVVTANTTGWKSIRASTEDTECSYGASHTIITQSDVPVRPRGSHTRRPSQYLAAAGPGELTTVDGEGR